MLPAPKRRIRVAWPFALAFLAARFAAPGWAYDSANSQKLDAVPPSQAQQAAPTPTPATSVEELLREGFRLYGRDEYEPARQHFERALTLARAEKNLGAEAEAHRGLGLILYHKAAYPAAQAELKQALYLFEILSDRLGIARVHNHLGSVARYTGNLTEAQELYRKALAEYEALGHLRGQAAVLLNLTLGLGLPSEEEEKLLQQGLEISRQLGDKGLEGSFLHTLGDKYFVQGNFSAALEKLEQAAACFEQVNDRSGLARVLTSLGRLHRAHGSYEQAIEFYRRGLKIQEEIGDQQGVIQSLNAMAVAYSFLGKHKEVLEHYQRALALARQTGSPRLINFMLGALGSAYLDMGDYARAAELFEEVLRQDIEPGLAAYRYSGLADAYLGLGRYARALETAEKAVEFAYKTGNIELLFHPLQLRARAKAKLGQISDALANTGEALRVIEQLRARLVPTDFMKRGFSDRHQELFAFAIELHQQLDQPKEALEIAEQARARAFLDLLATRQLQAKASEPSELAALRKLESELQSQGPGSTESAKGQMYALTLRGAGTDLPSPASATTFSSEQMVATAARLRSTFLSYWVNPHSTYIWVVKPDGSVRAVRVEVPAQRLSQLVRETWAGLEASPEPGTQSAAGKDEAAPATAKKVAQIPRMRGGDALVLDETQKQAWRELYRLLIRPVRSLLPAAPGSLLTIVPHGPLFLLSFAALLDDHGRYLVETYRLHYTPAGAVLQFTETKKHQLAGRAPHYLLVADPTGLPRQTNEKQLPPLPGARKEVAAVARSLPRNAVTVLLGAQAQEQEVREAMREKTVVHFATHGIVRDERPFDSFLALGGNGPAGPNDGRLTAQEIYGLDLKADLVVLSSCRSALGKLSGDGIVGFTRAFFYAGTPSVMATLWDVADEPTYLLVSDFYHSLRQTHDKSRALRTAQLRLLRALREGRVKVATPAGNLTLPEHPVFWASFVLLGEP